MVISVSSLQAGQHCNSWVCSEPSMQAATRSNGNSMAFAGSIAKCTTPDCIGTFGNLSVLSPWLWCLEHQQYRAGCFRVGSDALMVVSDTISVSLQALTKFFVFFFFSLDLWEAHTALKKKRQNHFLILTLANIKSSGPFPHIFQPHDPDLKPHLLFVLLLQVGNTM